MIDEAAAIKLKTICDLSKDIDDQLNDEIQDEYFALQMDEVSLTTIGVQYVSDHHRRSIRL